MIASPTRPSIPSTIRNPQQVVPMPRSGSIAALSPRPGMEQTQPVPPSVTAPPQTAAPLPSFSAGAFNVGQQNVPFNPQSFVGSDPYNFIRDQGLEGISRSHFANGTGLTGGTLKDLAQFASGNASTFWGQQLDHDYRMAGLNSGISEGNANRTVGGLSSLAGYGMNAAGGMGAAYGNTGMAQAGGTIGAQSAANQGVGSVANSLSQFFANRRAQQQGQNSLVNPQPWQSPWDTGGGG